MQAGNVWRLGLIFAAGMLTCAAAQAQEFRPSQQELLYRSTIAGSSSPAGFDRKDAAQKPAGAASAKTKPAASGGATAGGNKPASLSSELSAGQHGGTATPALKPQTATSAQRKPFDDKIPLGPLSLGLQAEGSPRSEALTTPSAPGAEQFKKDKFDPYVGFSIIDIKR